MTNEELRRASGAAMEQNRRNSGKEMEANRRGKQVVADVNRLLQPRRERPALPRIEPLGALPAQQGVASYQAPARSGAGGIASPLTEKTRVVDGKTVADGREYWPAGLKSSDGLFVYPAIKTLSMTDAEGAAVVINLAQPQ